MLHQKVCILVVFPLDNNYYLFSVSGFEFTSESGLFDLLDVALYHGWVVDPQDEVTYKVVSCYSYNQLAEMVVSKSNSRDEVERRNGNCCIYVAANYCV